jgi:hypothetical protein
MRGRERQEAPIRLDVGDGDQHGVVGDHLPVHFDAEGRQPPPEQELVPDAVVPEVAEHAIARLLTPALGRVLDLLEQAVAAVRQEDLGGRAVPGETDVDPAHVAVLK